jgi:hypothetical protein
MSDNGEVSLLVVTGTDLVQEVRSFLAMNPLGVLDMLEDGMLPPYVGGTAKVSMLYLGSTIGYGWRCVLLVCTSRVLTTTR